MKLNYTNTALSFLDNPENIAFDIPDSHVPMTKEAKKTFGHSLQQNFKTAAPMFKENIKYVSVPFIEAYFKARHKLKDVFDKEEINEAGTFIWNTGSYTFTNFYYIKTSGTGENWKCDLLFLQFSKHTKNEYQMLDVMISEANEIRKSFIWDGHFKQGYDTGYYIAFIVTFLCFIKHAELETKIIEPKARGKHAGTKYVNETKQRIEVLDSSWFTTIIRSDGFKVGGHFRFQRTGTGRSQKKLIWIQDFEKSGYTRKAKILTQQ